VSYVVINHKERRMRTRLIVRFALAAAGLATLGACATIPERAWANGRGMTSTPEYQMKLNGDFSFDTQRRLYVKSSPLSLSSPVRYMPSRYNDR
jgi:hypothetical protein